MAGVQDQIDIVTEDGEQAGNHGCNGFEDTGSNPASLKTRQGSQSVSGDRVSVQYWTNKLQTKAFEVNHG